MFGINIAFSCKMGETVGWNDGLFNYSISGTLSPLFIPISGWSKASSCLPGMSGSNWGEFGLCRSLEDSHLPIFISNDFHKPRQHHLFSRLLQKPLIGSSLCLVLRQTWPPLPCILSFSSFLMFWWRRTCSCWAESSACYLPWSCIIFWFFPVPHLSAQPLYSFLNALIQLLLVLQLCTCCLAVSLKPPICWLYF